MNRMLFGLIAAFMSSLSQAAFINFEFTGELTSFRDRKDGVVVNSLALIPPAERIVTGRFTVNEALLPGDDDPEASKATYHNSDRSFLSFHLDGYDFTSQTQSVNDRERYPTQEHGDRVRVLDGTPADGVYFRDRFTTGSSFQSCKVYEMCFEFILKGPSGGFAYLPQDAFSSSDALTNKDVPLSLEQTNFVSSDGETPSNYNLSIYYANGLGDKKRLVSGNISVQSIRVAPVPLPASGLLLAGALLASLGLRKRIRQSAR